MTPRYTDKKAKCSAADARVLLGHAKAYLTAAELMLDDLESDESTVATGNAVLAAIAAADAMCCALAGQRPRGENHRCAADFLEEVTGDKALGGRLRDAIDLKESGHYGSSNVTDARANRAVRAAKALITAAEERVH